VPADVRCKHTHPQKELLPANVRATHLILQDLRIKWVARTFAKSFKLSTKYLFFSSQKHR
jgi:hypothetical protein